MEVFALFFGINDQNDKLIRRTEILPLSATNIDTILKRQPINTVKGKPLQVIDIKENKVYRKIDLFTVNLMQRPGLADSVMLENGYNVAFNATHSGKVAFPYIILYFMIHVVLIENEDKISRYRQYKITLYF